MAEILLKETGDTTLNVGDTTKFLNVKQGRKEHHVWEYTIAGIVTDVTVRVEGSNTEANGSEKAFNLNPNDVDTVKTANGTFGISIPSVPVEKIRFNFVGATGGTPTIVVNYAGGG